MIRVSDQNVGKNEKRQINFHFSNAPGGRDLPSYRHALTLYSSFSELNSVESTESIEFAEYYISLFLFKKLPKVVF